MNIDEYDFDRTAQAVFIMNPSAAKQHDTWEELRSFMISMAYAYGHTTNSFSTSGFQLTFFNGTDGDIHCRSSVSAFVALEYAKRVEKQLSCLEEDNALI